MNNIQVSLQEKVGLAMRNFEQLTRAATKVMAARPEELLYLRYLTLDSAGEPCPTEVRYFIQAENLVVGTKQQQMLGGVCTGEGVGEETKLVIEHLDQTADIFAYYNGGGEQLSPDEGGNIVAGDVRMIKINIALDKNKIEAPRAIGASTKVNLRNIKQNL